MPFIGPSTSDPARWRQVWTVDLRQKMETKPRKIEFKVLSEFGYTSQPPEQAADGSSFWRPAAIEHRVPLHMDTDLATVPSFLWGVVASYGRQTLPAILHDMLCYGSQLPGQPRPFRRKARREADTLFRETLRDSGSGVVRRWLMWAGVRLGGRPLVTAAFALLLALVLLVLLVGPWRTVLVPTTVGVFGLLLLLIAVASRECDRTPAPPRGVRHDPSVPEYGPTRFAFPAFTGLIGALGIAAVAAPLLIPVTVVTLLTRAVLGVGEKRLPPGFTAAPDGASGLVAEGASARIEWAPMQPAADKAHPAPSKSSTA